MEIRFGDVEKTPQLERLIREKADKLEEFSDHLTSCRVAVEKPHKHPSGNPYRVRIDVTVPPGHELVVDKSPGDNAAHEDLENVIVGAFTAMERQLKELTSRQQKEVKHHEKPIAFVLRLFKDQDYGFLKTESDQEIFFHRNAVVDDDFDRLEVGTQVRFVAQEGEKGPQASTVKIIDKPGHRVSGEDPVPVPPGWKQK